MQQKGSDLAHAMTRVLTALYMNEGHAVIRDLADECSIPKSTLHRILQALKDEGWAYQAEDGGYRIGLRFLVMASQSRLKMELVCQLEPMMKQLSERTRQTVVLSVLDQGQSVCLHTLESNRRIRINSQIGARGPLHAGASGKVLLAFGPEELRREILGGPLEKFTPFTLSEPCQLESELKTIRKKGYAISIEELDPGAAAIAVPLLDMQGDLIAGVSIAGPRFDFEDMFDEWIALMQSSTRDTLSVPRKTGGVEKEGSMPG